MCANIDLIAVLCPFGPLRLLIESSRNQQREVPALLYSVNAVWFMMATTEELAPLPHDEPGRKRAETQTSIQTINTSINTATDYDASTSSIVPLNAHAAAPATTNTTSCVDTQRDHVTSSLSSSDIPNRGEQERRNSNSSSTTIASRHETSPNTEDRDEEDGMCSIQHDVITQVVLILNTCLAERSGLKLGLGDFVFYSVLIARAGMFYNTHAKELKLILEHAKTNSAV